MTNITSNPFADLIPSNATPAGNPFADLIPTQSAKPSVGRTMLDQSLQGIPLVGTFMDEAAGRLGGLGAKAYDAMTGQNLFDGQSVADVAQQGQDIAGQNVKNELQQRPLLSIGSQLAGGLATGGIAAGTVPGQILSNSLRGGNLASRIGAGVAAGAASGAAYGAGAADSGERTQGAESSALLGGGIGAAAPLVGAAVNAVTPVVSDALRPIAQKAQEYGIPLSLSQVTGNKTGNLITSAAGKIPFSGASSFQKSQQTAFNRNVLDTIGINADKVTPQAIKVGYQNITNGFNSALKGQEVHVSDDMINRLGDIEKQAQDKLIPDNFGIVKKQIDNFMGLISPDGTISGEKLGNLRSELAAQSKGAGTERSYIGQLKNFVQDVSVDGAPDKKAILQDSIQKFRNYQIIKPLLNKAVNGDISPSLLLNRVASNYGDFAQGGGGKLGDLARIGQVFLKDAIPDSGTAQRAMAYKALGGLGKLGGAGVGYMAGGFPGAAAAIGAPITAARGINMINTSKKLVQGAINRTPQTAATPLLNKNALYQLINQLQGTQ